MSPRSSVSTKPAKAQSRHWGHVGIGTHNNTTITNNNTPTITNNNNNTHNNTTAQNTGPATLTLQQPPQALMNPLHREAPPADYTPLRPPPEPPPLLSPSTPTRPLNLQDSQTTQEPDSPVENISVSAPPTIRRILPQPSLPNPPPLSPSESDSLQGVDSHRIFGDELTTDKQPDQMRLICANINRLPISKNDLKSKGLISNLSLYCADVACLQEIGINHYKQDQHDRG